MNDSPSVNLQKSLLKMNFICQQREEILSKRRERLGRKVSMENIQHVEANNTYL